MLQYLGAVEWDCITNKNKTFSLQLFSYQVEIELFAGYWLFVGYICDLKDGYELFT